MSSPINNQWNEILWKIVINKKVEELLTVISNQYPSDFTYDEYASTIIHFKKIITYYPENKKAKKTADIESKANTNDNTNDNTNESKGKKARKIAEDSLRCWARCWKLDDANGYRCTLKKSGSLYCRHHERNLPHGKFGDNLTPAQLSNFQKNGKAKTSEVPSASSIKNDKNKTSNIITLSGGDSLIQNT